MLFSIDPKTGDVSKVKSVDKEEDKVLEICARIREELEGWLGYHEMAVKSEDKRYTTISAQEFQHALVAMSDLLEELKDRLTPEEKEQFHKFKAECLK